MTDEQKLTPNAIERLPETPVHQPPSIMGMLAHAVQAGQSIEVVRELMAMSKELASDEARRAFEAAMSAAKSEFPVILKNRVVDFSSQKGRTHYKHEDLGEIAKAVDPILGKHGLTYPLMYWEMDIDDWITSGQCRTEGQEFHQRVAKAFPGKDHHGADDVHDCYVGAAVCMVRAKQVEKALLFYNRWARLAGYAQLAVISQQPLVIDAQGFLIEVVGGDYELKGK